MQPKSLLLFLFLGHEPASASPLSTTERAP
jgi:hypothetical protein